MTIKDKVLSDLNEIGSPKLLYQILEFIRLLKKNYQPKVGNAKLVLASAGKLEDEEAEQIRDNIQDEFNKIEGDW